MKQDEEKLSKLTPNQSLRQLIDVWVDIEVNSPVAEMKSGDDIIADILQEEQDKCDEQEDEESEDPVPAIADSQAVQAAQLLMDYEGKPVCNFNVYFFLRSYKVKLNKLHIEQRQYVVYLFK